MESSNTPNNTENTTLAEVVENKSGKPDIMALVQKVPLAEILKIAEDVAEFVPVAGGPIKIVIKILRLLLKVKV